MRNHDLPDNWVWTTFDDISDVIVDGPFGSNLKTSDYVPEGVPVLQGKNITNNQFRWFDIRYVTEDKAESLKRSKVFLNDHLMIKIGSIGYSAILDNLHGHPFAIIPANMAKITPNRKLVDDRYLHNWLTSIQIKRHLEKVASKTAQPALSLKKIKASPIPLPPLPEQKRIAAILDKADALRAKRRTALAKLDTLLQSTFLEMFGDPVTNPMGWEVKSLGEITDVKTGSTPSRKQEDNYGGNVPWVKTTEVNWGTITQTEETVSEQGVKSARLKVFPKDSILIAMYGQGKTRGKSAVLGIDATVNQACAVLLPTNNFETEYITVLLKHSYENIRTLGRGGNQPNLNLSLVKSFPIILPPIDVQFDFAQTVKSIRKMKESHNTQLQQLDNLFHALQQRAFKGDL